MKARLMAVVWVLGGGSAYADYHGELGVEYINGSIDIGSSYSIPEYEPPTGGPVDPPLEPPPVTPGLSTPGDDEDYEGWAVSGQVFFEPVDTSQGPLQLAEFLSRASSVGGHYGQLETDDTDTEIEFWDLYTRVVVNEALVLEAGFGNSETDFDGGADVDVDLYRGAVGYYVGDTTQVRLGYDVEDQDFVEFERWAVDVMHVQQLENGMTWRASLLYGVVRGDTDFGRDDDGHDLEVAASWFFSHNFGVGANLAMNDRDVSGDADYYEVWASYFPREKVSLTLSYYDEENEDLDVNSDAVMFEAKYRF